MTRLPFQPADGETPRWRKLYDLVISKQLNEEITYREAVDLLDCDLRAAQVAMRETTKRLEQDGQQSIRTVPNFGWVVMRAAEHLNESERHLRKTRNSARRAHRKITAIDGRRSELSQFERERADRLKLTANAAAELTGRRRLSLTELHKRTPERKELA